MNYDEFIAELNKGAPSKDAPPQSDDNVISFQNYKDKKDSELFDDDESFVLNFEEFDWSWTGTEDEDGNKI